MLVYITAARVDYVDIVVAHTLLEGDVGLAGGIELYFYTAEWKPEAGGCVSSLLFSPRSPPTASL